MRYEVFEHTSDIGLLIYGSSFKELLENAGYSLFDQMTDISRVEIVDSLDLSVTGENAEELFINWLRELLYLFHVERYLLKEFEVIELKGNALTASVKGEKMNTGKHVMEGEVKGITYHKMEVREIAGGWQARVILDV